MKKHKNTIHIDRAERELVLRALKYYADKSDEKTDVIAAIAFINEMERLIHEE